MTSLGEAISKLSDLQMGICPKELCHRRVLFRKPVQRVKCRWCEANLPVDQLLDVKEAPSVDVAMQWIQHRASDLEKMAVMTNSRLRIVSRLIDGIGGVSHMAVLSQYFERFGVNDDGRVKRLSEMGRSEPINVVTLSNYAFGIRQEHIDVSGYGQVQPVCAQLRRVMKSVNDVAGNRRGDANALVPLQIIEQKWFLNAIAAVCRACVGREIFVDPLRDRVEQHLAKHGETYKRMMGYSDLKWTILTRLKPADTSLEATPTTRLALAIEIFDLGVLANVLYRTILLLDGERTSIRAFVPFLRKPEHCRNQDGIPRSPLVLAWGDEFKVPMVAVAGTDEIPTVKLPRQWFSSVWGFDQRESVDDQLSKYLAFDQNGRCAVANGKYFKPEFLREYVTAFDGFSLIQEGVHAALMSDYLDDIVRISDIPKQHLSGQIINKAFDDELERCVKCGRLFDISLDEDQLGCLTCGSGSHLRKQRADGTIKYLDGDHTMTPAPGSWCFSKRKHFYNGRELDNAPYSEQQGSARSALEHQFKHLTQYLVHTTYDQLFDNFVPALNAEAKRIIDNAKTLYEDVIRNCMKCLKEGGMEATDDELFNLMRTNDVLREAENEIFARLRKAMGSSDDTERLAIFSTDSSLFVEGGLFYTYARRRFKGQSHFKLPLLENWDFAFSKADKALVMCVKGTGNRSAETSKTVTAQEGKECDGKHWRLDE